MKHNDERLTAMVSIYVELFRLFCMVIMYDNVYKCQNYNNHSSDVEIHDFLLFIALRELTKNQNARAKCCSKCIFIRALILSCSLVIWLLVVYFIDLNTLSISVGNAILQKYWSVGYAADPSVSDARAPDAIIGDVEKCKEMKGMLVNIVRDSSHFLFILVN